MEYTSFEQGNFITPRGLKYFLRVVDECHEDEIADLLKSATIYVQEYINKPLVNCTVIQDEPEAGKAFALMLANQTDIKVVDYVTGLPVAFTQEGRTVHLLQPAAVKIAYTCTAVAESARWAQLVYEIAGATFDGQPEAVPAILAKYPVI